MQALSDMAPRLDERIVAQTGNDDCTWPGLDHQASFSPGEYKVHCQNARLIVAHAGVGSILSAKKWGKPLVIMPRRHDLGEHRNDHQQATAKQVAKMKGVYLAWDAAALESLVLQKDLVPADADPSEGTRRLVQFIRDQL